MAASGHKSQSILHYYNIHIKACGKLLILELSKRTGIINIPKKGFSHRHAVVSL